MPPRRQSFIHTRSAFGPRRTAGAACWKKQDLPHFEYKEDKFIPTARIEAEQLADAAVRAGIITDKELWIRYMTGEAALTPGNLRALFAKVLKQYNINGA